MQTRDFNGRGYVLETAIHADFALVRAYQADTKGNVTFRRTANNYNEVIAKAAKNVVVEVRTLTNYNPVLKSGRLTKEEAIYSPICISKIFFYIEFTEVLLLLSSR